MMRRGAATSGQGPPAPRSAADVTLRQLDQIAAERQLAVAERAREQSDKRLQRLVENLGDQYFLYETDTAGRFTFASPSVKLVLGYEVGEFLHLYTDFLTDHPMNAEARRRTEASNRGEQQPPYLVEVRHRDGTPRRLEVQEVPVLARRVVGFVEGTARDVTRELELREAMRIQAAALEATSNSIAITDAAGELVWVNSAFCAASGYSREEVLGRNPRILRSGEQDAEFYRLMWATISSGQDWTGEPSAGAKTDEPSRGDDDPPIRDSWARLLSASKRDVRTSASSSASSCNPNAWRPWALCWRRRPRFQQPADGNRATTRSLGFVPDTRRARRWRRSGRRPAGRCAFQQLLTFSRKQAVKPQVIDRTSRLADGTDAASASRRGHRSSSAISPRTRRGSSPTPARWSR
jgi:PAS domain S-box-containing protein